jgi:hypothetical protein
VNHLCSILGNCQEGEAPLVDILKPTDHRFVRPGGRRAIAFRNRHTPLLR